MLPALCDETENYALMSRTVSILDIHMTCQSVDIEDHVCLVTTLNPEP
jgi:hypothetical protein